MPANETRGEASISLEGIEYVMRPSYAAIDEFEQATGKALKELFDLAASDRLMLRDLAAVIGACVRAKGEQDGDRSVSAFKDSRIREIVPGEPGGILIATRTVALVLMMAVTGGVDSKGEAKAPATMTTTSEHGILAVE
jgi:hypothetical protein